VRAAGALVTTASARVTAAGEHTRLSQVTTGDIASEFGRPDPRKVGDMKVVSATAWEKIVGAYGLGDGQAALSSTALCAASVSAECVRRRERAAESAEAGLLRELFREAPAHEGVSAPPLPVQSGHVSSIPPY